jgi:hypothetical protein
MFAEFALGVGGAADFPEAHLGPAFGVVPLGHGEDLAGADAAGDVFVEEASNSSATCWTVCLLRSEAAGRLTGGRCPDPFPKTCPT